MRLVNHRIAAEAHYLLPACAREGPGVLALLAQYLQRAQLPGAFWAIESLTAGSLWMKEVRPSLIIGTHLFPEHRVIVTFIDRGAGALGVSKYLVIRPTVFRDLRRAFRILSPRPERTVVGAELTPLARADLGAFDGLVDDLLQRVMRTIIRECSSSEAKSEGLGIDGE